MAGLPGSAQSQPSDLPPRTYTRACYNGLHNNTTPRYDEAAAQLAWRRTLDFFNKYLRAE